VQVLVPSRIHAQDNAATPTFDVASIKRNKSDAQQNIQFLPNGVNFTNVTLRTLVQLAYQIQQQQRLIGGPGWMNSDRFDIAARAATTQTGDVMRKMMQALLVERFALVARKETREMPGYELVRDSGSEPRPGLKASAPCTPPTAGRGRGAATPNGASPAGLPTCGPQPGGPGRIILLGAPLPQLTSLLTLAVGQPVVDKTGMTERFDVELTFRPERLPADAPGDLLDRPSLFTAVREQLGLRLVAMPQQVEVLVIDSVQPPTED
jgi:uncharacterized protein (TIGR03435 family)